MSGVSACPAEILYSRRLRSKIPTSPIKLQPHIVHNVRQQLLEVQETHKSHYDKSAKPLVKLNINDTVRILNRGTWKPAVLKEQHQTAPRSYIVQSESGNELRRNRRHLQRTLEPPHQIYPANTNYRFLSSEQTPLIAAQPPDQSRLNTPVAGTDQNVVDDSETDQDHTMVSSPPTPSRMMSTRSGRLVRPPIKLDL